ncbi:hypothetical protein [Bradyrhizobium sp. 2S1]|uniref:hypothetical protein n=1 Tax=Bradyrhizobium sp. 2S1 TaxID=1404429 RepID=UPI001409459E|nr:hypothetical protein [Bradyrhizobium sp. 2S1]MCK7670994.1 hypothetical protein [Bradyrhizobium sp. 2S1]
MSGYCKKIIDTLKPLLRDRRGVVSFEYIILAVCVVVVVIAVFSPGNDVATALTSGVIAISSAIVTAAGT